LSQFFEAPLKTGHPAYPAAPPCSPIHLPRTLLAWLVYFSSWVGI